MEENKSKEVVNTKEVTEMQLIQAKQAAEFALTPVGQVFKQFEVQQRMAQMYSASTIVPDIYIGNIGNCVIAIDMSMRMKANPLMVMQNLYIVHGNPSFSSKFLIGTINASGRFTTLRFKKSNIGKVGMVKYKEKVWNASLNKYVQCPKEFDGSNLDNIECVAYATDLNTGEELSSDPVSISLDIQEGWYTKDNSKWVTMPMLMLSYRAAAFWQRIYCPEISMGLITKEEYEDISDAEYTEIKKEDRLSSVASEAVGKENNTAAVTKLKPKKSLL